MQPFIINEQTNLPGSYSFDEFSFVSGLIKFQTINLSINNYSCCNKIPEGLFLHLKNLTELFFKASKTAYLTSGFLAGLGRLEQLEIRNVHLDVLNKDFFKFSPNIKYLNLDDCVTPKIDVNAFESLSNLKSLQMKIILEGLMFNTKQDIDFSNYQELLSFYVNTDTFNHLTSIQTGQIYIFSANGFNLAIPIKDNICPYDSKVSYRCVDIGNFEEFNKKINEEITQ